jgi:lysophospholipase L1-like esterase
LPPSTSVRRRRENPQHRSWRRGRCGQTPRITADQLIAGYQTLIRAAHARGVRIIGATIIPFKAPYMSPAGYQRAEAIRDQVNHWIRTSGDFLHPNDAGYRAIAAVIKPNEL